MAMAKPVGYDQAEATESGYMTPKPGPCVLGVVKCDVEMKEGSQQLVFHLDIAEGKFKNYYRNLGKKVDKNVYLRYWQKTDGKSLGYYKGLIQAFEESNQDFFFSHTDEKELERKFIGGNLREEEYRTGSGEIKTRLRIEYLCSVVSIVNGEHKVLPTKKLKDEGSSAPVQQTRQPGQDDDEPLPEPPNEF